MEHRQECEVDNNEVVEIKIENESLINIDNQECERTKTFEQLFIKQEDDEHNETIEALNRIKSEPNDVDWDKYDPDYKNILEVEMENNKLDMEMQNQELIFKKDSNKNIDAISGIASSRIKSEYSSIDNSNECEIHENQDLNIQLSRMKREIDMDTEGFQATEITEEFAIKNEGETSADGASNSMAKTNFPKERQVVDKKTGRKSFSCYNCDYTVYYKSNLIRHMKQHDKKSKFIASVPDKHNRCIHCNAVFKNKITVYDHIVRKHPNFIESINRKLHECTKCTYKTVQKSYLARHMLKHPETTLSSQLSTCIHCHVTFRTRRGLDDHVVRMHPNLGEEFAKNIYKCTKCSYKTIIKHHFMRHISVHPDSDSYTCVHCNVIYKRKTSLNEHMMRKHPDVVNSFDDPIETKNKTKLQNVPIQNDRDLTCNHCNMRFKNKALLDYHLDKKHSNEGTLAAASRYKRSICVHCNMSFKKKMLRDNHVVTKHPSFITSISRKIYECTNCSYKTTIKYNFARHLPTHTETGSNTCSHCNVSFKCKISLDDHLVKKHPNFIDSVTRKIYQCTKCTYKTTLTSSFNRHNVVVHKIK